MKVPLHGEDIDIKGPQNALKVCPSTLMALYSMKSVEPHTMPQYLDGLVQYEECGAPYNAPVP